MNLISYQNAVINELKKKLTNKENINKEIIDQTTETIDSIKEERSKYYDKYKQTLLDYNQVLKQLNDAENLYSREIGVLNRTIDNNKIKENELRYKIQNLEDTIQKKINYIDILIDEIKKIQNISENDKKMLQKRINELIDDNDKLEDFIELYNDIVKEEQDKIYYKLDKFKDNMINNMNNLDKKVIDKENNLNIRLNKSNDNVKKINKYNKEKYQDNIHNVDNRIRQLENELSQNNNLSDVRQGKLKKDIKELTEYKYKYEKFSNKIDEIINAIKDDKKYDYININLEKNIVKNFLFF